VSRKDIIDVAENVLKAEPLVSQIEYISVASHKDMKELDHVHASDGGAVLSSAIRLGSVRLIDNLLVGSSRQLLEISKATC